MKSDIVINYSTNQLTPLLHYSIDFDSMLVPEPNDTANGKGHKIFAKNCEILIFSCQLCGGHLGFHRKFYILLLENT